MQLYVYGQTKESITELGQVSGESFDECMKNAKRDNPNAFCIWLSKDKVHGKYAGESRRLIVEPKTKEEKYERSKKILRTIVTSSYICATATEGDLRYVDDGRCDHKKKIDKALGVA